MRKERLFLLLVAVFLSLSTFSQSVTPATLNTTGGHYIFTNYIVEWSFGESMAIETMTTPNLVITNGVLQPGTNTPATINNQTPWDKDEIKITPNPTPDVLQIDFFSKQKGRVTLTLFDESGRVMGRREFLYHGIGRIERWSLGRFANGAYFLNIQLDPTGNSSVRKNGSYKVMKLR